MKRIGLIGLGDMGIGLARNLIKHGFPLTAFDLRDERLRLLAEAGGKPGGSVADVGQNSDSVFVMVLNGQQVLDVVGGKGGLRTSMQPGSTIIVSATIAPSEMRAVADLLDGSHINLIDTPVSGGKSGADSGTLTMMAAAKPEVFAAEQDVLGAVGEHIFHVGEEIGQGQTVKAALQALIGSTFTAIFESLVLGTKGGVPGRVLYDVFYLQRGQQPVAEKLRQADHGS